MNRRQVLGASVALAAATILVGRTGFASGDDKGDMKKPAAAKKTVKCLGGNDCKGKGECASADGKHGCAGSNDCKGKGWVMVSSADECAKAGGKVEPKKKS